MRKFIVSERDAEREKDESLNVAHEGHAAGH